MSYKIYRRHNCDRRHRTWLTTAKCIWPGAVWITGEGPYALLAHCRVLSITLWDDPDEAEVSKDFIDRLQCGGRCYGDHEIIHLETMRS